MSQSHSHGPGQPSHSHGPTPPPQQQQQAVMRPPDPVMQALIEASFVPVDVGIAQDNFSLLCTTHSKEKCADCDVDYAFLNRISKTLLMNPAARCPPPPNAVNPKLSQAVEAVKNEGNTMFKSGQHEKAIQRYTMAANIAAQRPPWEASQVTLTEISTVLSNRSASFLEAGDYIGALVDAETVINIRRPWSKGHFRKAKALMKLGRYSEAKEAIQLGLSYEFGNAEMAQMLSDIEKAWKLHEEQSIQEKQANPPPITAS